MDLIQARLRNQRLTGPGFSNAAQVVAWFGAVQAQDYLGSLWAVGLRTRTSNSSLVEQAIAQRLIIRTWPMRGTLHYVAAQDARWMLQLLAPRIIQRHRARLAREFALDDQVLARCRKILQATLKSGLPRPRSELYARLESAGVSAEGQRGIHILGRLAQEGLVCYGPRIGKQATFVLLDEWLPPVPPLTREESLGELARRYFTSHGPATLGDFTWWSGLTAREGREAISLLGSGLTEKVNHGESYWSGGRAYPRSDRGSLHLLPPFDEYLVGYKQRADVLEARYTKRVRMLLSPVIEIGGRIAGTWGREITRSGMKIRLQSFKKVGPGDRTSLTAAAEQYAEFFGAACSVEIR